MFPSYTRSTKKLCTTGVMQLRQCNSGIATGSTSTYIFSNNKPYTESPNMVTTEFVYEEGSYFSRLR